MLELDEYTKARVENAFNLWWEPWRDAVTDAERAEALRIFTLGVRWTLSQALLKMLG